MLSALRIQNLAVIDEVEVRFGPGLNVLTGETGAGKSIVVDAAHLAMGSRAETDVVRTGADEAVIEALFTGVDLSDRLAAVGLPPRGPEALVRRVVSRGGRSRAWINGSMATVGMLEQVTGGLVDFSDQHGHLGLTDSETQLNLLDGFAGVAAQVVAYREVYDALLAAQRELSALQTDDAERARRADYLAFQVDEIDKLEPRAGEDEALAAERLKLASAEKLRAAATETEAALYSAEGAAVEVLGSAATRLAEAAAFDPTLVVVADCLKGTIAELEEAARLLGRYATGLAADPSRLAEVEERLDALRRLCRKHGGDLVSVLAHRDAMKVELDGISRHGERLAQLTAQVVALESRARGFAVELTERRRTAARDFSRAVKCELDRLAMTGTAFEARLAQIADGGGASAGLGPRGADEVTMMLSANAGEVIRPLAKVASGGELSRVLLAVKKALAPTNPVTTYVFDEVDSGIGGAVAEVVGRMLKDVAAGRQVLCVTHLPQIAAFADRHFVVRKARHSGRTQSTVAEVSADDRTTEIARMVAGLDVTPAAVEHAGQMLLAARKRRRA